MKIEQKDDGLTSGESGGTVDPALYVAPVVSALVVAAIVVVLVIILRRRYL